MAMIEVEDLRKNYGSFRALRGVTFSVDRGEILGFLGPNGAGKTTTMKILTGFLNPSGGRARVAGHDVLEDSVEVRRKIGYLPEHTPLYEEMAVIDYLRYCGKLRKMGFGTLGRRLREVIDITGLGPKRRALIKTLSKGYRQRVGLAQALLHEPEIIILDEPTVGLDPNQVVEVRSLIRSIGEDRTVILCSHILSEVEATCGRVVIINDGQIVAAGTPDALKAAHADQHLYTVTVEGSAESLEAALASVSGIGPARITRDAGGRAAARFSATEGPTPVVQAVAGAGLELISLVPEQPALEDVFRSFTSKESA